MRTPLLLLTFLCGCIFTANAQKNTRFGFYASGGNFSFPQKQNDFLLLFPKGSNQFHFRGGMVGNLSVWSDQVLGKCFRLYESIGFRYSRYSHTQHIDLPDYQNDQETNASAFAATLPVLLVYTPDKWSKWSVFGGGGLSYTLKEMANVYTAEQFLPAPVERGERHITFRDYPQLNGFLSAGLQYQVSTQTWIGLQFTSENSFKAYQFSTAGDHYINPTGEKEDKELNDDFGINMRSFSVSLRYQLWP